MAQPLTGLDKALNPFWLDPTPWQWRNGVLKFGLNNLRDDPGLLNLFWLALDMDEPPVVYNTAANPLCVWVLVDASREFINKAAQLSLKEFAELKPVNGYEWRLITIAKRKCHDA